MVRTQKLTICLVAVLLSGFANPTQQALARDVERVVHMQNGQEVLELIGQVDNSGSPAPLGSSIQYGYISLLKGVDNVFSGPLENESTAQFTFYTEVNTTRVASQGPFSVIVREGTTTLYLNSLPATFTTSDSFRSGIPIQVSAIHQQVIVDTVEKTFTVINMNTIESVSRFVFDGQELTIGAPGEGFRTSLQGVLFVRSGGVPPPTGHFAGYAVGVQKADRNEPDDDHK